MTKLQGWGLGELQTSSPSVTARVLLFTAADIARVLLLKVTWP